ncbi:MAG: hypothetical protein K8J31_14660 [Anaerolineae bacterium]|nr:hypothetical protein [Anaerolineae bacterium]
MTLLRDQTPKTKMEYARELIKTKRYDEARAILEKVDHPKAREWLVKLDQIAPRAKPEKKVRKGGCMPLILLFALAFGLFVIMIWIADSRLPASPPLPTPTSIPITRCSGPQLVSCYREQMAAALKQKGSTVSGIGDELISGSGGRLDSWVDVELNGPRDYATAKSIIEQALRVYAGAMPSERAGSFLVTVSWTRDGRQCSDNAGMGYETMQRVNWDNVSQQGIFDAIDRNIYRDVDGPYSQIGIAPDPSQFPECNR